MLVYGPGDLFFEPLYKVLLAQVEFYSHTCMYIYIYLTLNFLKDNMWIHIYAEVMDTIGVLKTVAQVLHDEGRGIMGLSRRDGYPHFVL